MELKAKIRRIVNDGGSVKAVLSMRYGELKINHMRLEFQGGRLVLTMPSRKKHGKSYDQVCPMTEGLRTAMEEEALRAYEKAKRGL